LNSGEAFAVVDAGGLDVGTAFSGGVYIEFCAIESPKIVDYGGIEFQGVVGLEE
jgi:hypothetical protein